MIGLIIRWRVALVLGVLSWVGIIILVKGIVQWL